MKRVAQICDACKSAIIIIFIITVELGKSTDKEPPKTFMEERRYPEIKLHNRNKEIMNLKKNKRVSLNVDFYIY